MLTTIYLLRLKNIADIKEEIVILAYLDTAFAGIICGYILTYLVRVI